MFDTNILLSVSLFPTRRTDNLLDCIVSEHELVLADLVTKEFLDVAAYEKFGKARAAQAFLEGLQYTEYKTPPVARLRGVSIRDKKDYPILFAAVKSGVDIFLSGDKDFLESGVVSPKMMTMAQFMTEYTTK